MTLRRAVLVGALLAGAFAFCFTQAGEAAAPQSLAIAATDPPGAYLVSPRHESRGVPDVVPTLLRVFVERDAVRLVYTKSDYRPRPAVAFARDGHEWEQLGRLLATERTREEWLGLTFFELVPADGLPYRDLIRAMEVADHAGFPDAYYQNPHCIFGDYDPPPDGPC